MNEGQPVQFDWEQFGKYMKRQFPYIHERLWLGNADDLKKGRIDSYVEKAMKGFFNDSARNPLGLLPFAKAGIAYEIFESHRCVFVRCRLPHNRSLQAPTFHVKRRKLKIEHGRKTEIVPLMSDVNPSLSSAKLKDGIWEVRMPKSREPQPYRKINIGY